MSATSTAWLFDLGNSRLKGAAMQGRVLSNRISLAWEPPDFDVDLLTQLRRWPAPEQVLIASVVSATRAERLRDALQSWPQARQQWLRSPREGCGISNRYRIAERLGIDRFLAMAAARAEASNAGVVVVGCGTAMTLDAVDAQGRQQEGMIAPSMELMLRSLRGATAIGESNPSAFDAEDADDSARALQQGCMRAAASLAQWHYARYRIALDHPPLWLHGGGANALLGALEGETAQRARVLDDAVLRGLQLWAGQMEEPQ